MVALDKNGHLVTEDSEDAARQGDGPLADAVVSEEKAVATTETHDGVATLYVAPTRYDGRCAWLELAGRDRSLTPCVPHGYPFAPFALRFASTPDDVVLAGSVAEHVARVVVRYADGDLATVRPRDGFVLYLVPAAHLTAGHEATKIVGEDQTGTALNELDVGLMAAVNPCFGSLPLSGSAGRGCR